MPAIVERFSRRYPGIRLHVVLANIAMLQFQELRERNVDLLIGRMPQPFVEDDLTAEILFDEPFLAVAECAAGGRASGRSGLTSSSASPGFCRRMTVRRPAHRRNFPRQRAATLRSPASSPCRLQLTVTLIASGRFVGLLPSSVAQFNARRVGLKLVPV